MCDPTNGRFTISVDARYSDFLEFRKFSLLDGREPDGSSVWPFYWFRITFQQDLQCERRLCTIE